MPQKKTPKVFHPPPDLIEDRPVPIGRPEGPEEGP